MTPVGPATESGAPVVPSAPKTAAERLERLMQLADEAADRAREECRATSGVGVAVQADAFLTILSRHACEHLAQAAQAWSLEVAQAREESREMLAIAHDRIAQLEEAVERLSVDLDETKQTAQAASERHAVESGRQRRTIAALIRQLGAEMERGGGA